MIIITFGTFDLFHIGHLNIIKYCKSILDESNDIEKKIIIGVSSDELNYKKKNKYPEINLQDRMEIIKNIKGVDEVFIEESLDYKLDYCLKYKANILVMGDDHKGRFDYLEKHNINVIYKPRTKNISTTKIKDNIKNNKNII